MRVRGGRWVLMVLGLVLSSCQQGVHAAQPANQSAAVGKQPLHDRKVLGRLFRFRFALYLPDAPKTELGGEITAAATGTGLSVITQPVPLEPPPSATTLFFAAPDIKELAPPAPDSLEFRAKGLSAAEQQALLRSHYVAAFEVIGPGARALSDYRQALLFGQALATKLGGVLWDEEMRQAYTLAGWKSRIDSWQGELPDMTEHVSIDLYRDGELMRLVSLGMVKFALPDLAMNQVSVGDTRPMGHVMNLAMQRLVERQELDGPGVLRLALDEVAHARAKQRFDTDVLANAKRKVEVVLRPITPDEGDADNRLLELDFPGEGSAQERQSLAAATLFGSADSITQVKHDEALLAASARARKKAFGLRERYAKEPPFGERLLVKAPFATPDGNNEWMWVEVVRWNEDVITGILDNDPYEVPDLKAGARVEVSAEKIFDYILIKRDGTREGNETGKLLEAREKGR